jgi:hypothetical protein
LADRDVLERENGEPVPADRRGETVCRLVAAAVDERRPSSAKVVCRPSDRAVSAGSELLRAMSGVTSTFDRDSTSRKTRSISEAGLARLGDLVVSGPVITTPTSSPADDISRSPGRATRARLGLANSS